MVLPLAKLRQVPPLLKAALKARSITTCDHLLAAAGRFDDRAALARAIHAAPDRLTELVRRADLARVKGIGTVFGGMLEELGIGDVATLARQKPGRLHERLRRHNEAEQLARRSPTAQEVMDWIDQARRLPILVTYQPRGQEAAS
jgi:predicted flap endonuclease-1-like 5' DNA nuclease